MQWQGWEQLQPTLRRANFWDSGRDARAAGGFGPRYIEEFQILFVQGGRGVAVVEGRHFDLASGDVVYYGPNVCHQVRAVGDEPLRLVGLVFVFRDADRDRLPTGRHVSDKPIAFPRGKPTCPLTPAPPTHVRTTPASSVRRLCESLVLSELADPTGRPLEKRGLLLMLIEAWHDAIVQRDRQPPQSLPHRRAIESAERRIRENPAAPLDVERLAEQAGLSPAYFARLFKQHVGSSVKAYAMQHRLLRARRLLVEDGQLNVSQIARAVGFDDPFYFSRLFTRQFGVSPANFRHTGRGI